MSPTDLPPPNLSRLFIGGLPPSLPTSSLVRLLSKFVHPHTIDRHPTRPFAHISVSNTNETALTRCIAALNNTIWCGAALRVQKANPHYWHRLTQQWEEERQTEAAHEPVDQTQNLDNEHGKKWIHFEGAAKGKHLTFDFSDMENTDSALSFDDQVITPISDAGDPEPELTVTSDDSDTEPITNVNPARKVPMPKSAKLTSTMALFGLATSSLPHRHTEQPVDENTQSTLIDNADDATTRPPKRPRTSAVGEDEGSGRVPGEDAGQADLALERETALSVLRSMFPTDVPAKKTTEELIAQHRRLGLFRKLHITQVPQRNKRQRGDPLSRKQRQKLPSSLQTTPTSQGQIHTNEYYRKQRAGLFKKLVP